MRTFIERVDARSNSDVVRALERWKALSREGWDLTTTHHYKPTPTLTTFGYATSDDATSIDEFERLRATSDDDGQLFLDVDSPER